MSALKIVAVLGSVRDGCMGERVGKLLQRNFDAVMKPKGHSLEVIDPAKYNLPLLKQPFHFYKDQSQAPQELHDLNKIFAEADGYVFISPEYNKTLAPALVNLVDHFPAANFHHKTSAIMTYTMGTRSGCFAASAMMPFLNELGCLPIKTMVTISTVHKDVNEDGTSSNVHIDSSVGKCLDELEWWSTATKNMREASK